MKKKGGGDKFSREMETIRKNQIGILELENTRSERGSLETVEEQKSKGEKKEENQESFISETKTNENVKCWVRTRSEERRARSRKHGYSWGLNTLFY